MSRHRFAGPNTRDDVGTRDVMIPLMDREAMLVLRIAALCVGYVVLVAAGILLAI